MASTSPSPVPPDPVAQPSFLAPADLLDTGTLRAASGTLNKWERAKTIFVDKEASSVCAEGPGLPHAAGAKAKCPTWHVHATCLVDGFVAPNGEVHFGSQAGAIMFDQPPLKLRGSHLQVINVLAGVATELNAAQEAYERAHPRCDVHVSTSHINAPPSAAPAFFNGSAPIPSRLPMSHCCARLASRPGCQACFGNPACHATVRECCKRNPGPSNRAGSILA